MTDQVNNQQKRFISLQIKVLGGFTLIFALVFAVAFYWFYSVATKQAMTRIQEDLEATLEGAIAGTNTDELLALYEEGQPNDDGFSDDIRYENQLDWLEVVHDIEPRAWPYNYIKGNDEIPVIYIADLWQRYDASKAVQFLEPKYSQGSSYQGFSQLTYRLGFPGEETLEKWCEAKLNSIFSWCEDVEEFPLYKSGIIEEQFTTYTDEWGSWVSAYGPLTNSEGEVIGAIGIDFEANYVNEVQTDIQNRILSAFGIFYIVLFILVYIASKRLTKPIISLTSVAQSIGEGNYDQDLSPLTNKKRLDEISVLAGVFELMLNKVAKREQTLKARVQELEIMIDSEKRDEEVERIADSDFFQELKAKAKTIREKSEKKRRK